jgi:hypothetical protein
VENKKKKKRKAKKVKRCKFQSNSFLLFDYCLCYKKRKTIPKRLLKTKNTKCTAKDGHDPQEDDKLLQTANKQTKKRKNPTRNAITQVEYYYKGGKKKVISKYNYRYQTKNCQKTKNTHMQRGENG